MEIVNQNKDRRARRKSSIDLSTMVYGKIPPQARDLEEAVLGAQFQRLAGFRIQGLVGGGDGGWQRPDLVPVATSTSVPDHRATSLIGRTESPTQNSRRICLVD